MNTDTPPKGVIFGRATGFAQNRINIVVANYQARNLNRELALMNLKQHGVEGDAAEKLLGPNLELDNKGTEDNGITISEPHPSELIELKDGSRPEPVVRRRNGGAHRAKHV